MRRRYIDFGLCEKCPNKYGFTPKNINTVKVLDWNWIKEHFGQNFAMDKDGNCWDRIIDTKAGAAVCDEDEFYIGFWENGRVESRFYSHGGMCGYEFEEFYKADDIENEIDMEIQAKVIELLNGLVDKGIISKPEKSD